MNIGILTYHAAHNYGSILQAQSLQQAIATLGHQAIVIDYRPPIQTLKYTPAPLRHTLRAPFSLLRHPLQSIAAMRHYHTLRRYIDANIPLTRPTITSTAPLADIASQFDAIIAGSDQIWNPRSPEFQTAYLLDFIPPTASTLRIAYAPSIGPDGIDLNHPSLPHIRKAISRFNALSAREPATALFLSQASGTSVPTLLDPTLLIPANTWLQLAGTQPIHPHPYILLYTPASTPDPSTTKTIIDYATSHSLHILAISRQNLPKPLRHHRSLRILPATDPLKWLNLIRHATLLAGHSFHATLFALLFTTPILPTSDTIIDSRITNLLSITGIPAPEPLIPFTPPPLPSIQSALAPHIQSALAYLRNALTPTATNHP